MKGSREENGRVAVRGKRRNRLYRYYKQTEAFFHQTGIMGNTDRSNNTGLHVGSFVENTLQYENNKRPNQGFTTEQDCSA